MKAVVTGGAGFIGSYLTNQLDKVVVIDNLFLGKREFIKSDVDFFKTDLENFNDTLKIFKKYKFDVVFHLSANSDISYGTKHTDWDLKQGTLVTYNVLECMRRTGVKKIVFASSSN